MTAWSKVEVRRLIVEAVTPVVATAGFRWKSKREAFVRKIDDGRQELSLSLVDYNPLFEFSFSLCIRLEAAEEIRNRFSGSPPEFHDITLTSITQLEFLGLKVKGARGVAYSIRSAADLQVALPAVEEMIRQRVLPFFEQYCDVAAVNQGLNPPGTEGVFSRLMNFFLVRNERRAFDATNQPYRAMAGVTVAYLAGDARLPNLISAYRRQLRGARPDDLKKFEHLCAFVSAQ